VAMRSIADERFVRSRVGVEFCGERVKSRVLRQLSLEPRPRRVEESP